MSVALFSHMGFCNAVCAVHHHTSRCGPATSEMLAKYRWLMWNSTDQGMLSIHVHLLAKYPKVAVYTSIKKRSWWLFICDIGSH